TFVVAVTLKSLNANARLCPVAAVQHSASGPVLAGTRTRVVSRSSAVLTYRVTVARQHEPCGFFVSHQHASFIRVLISSRTVDFPVRRISLSISSAEWSKQ